MAKLIDRDSLLEKIQFRIEPQGIVGATVRDMVEKTREIILAEPTVGKWIPVTERLPEHHGDVLVFDACGCDVAWLMDDGKWSTTLISDYPVTHWMPLPEPPKEVE